MKKWLAIFFLVLAGTTTTTATAAGAAKQCTGFNTKNLCIMQRGCIWAPQKQTPTEPQPK